MPLTHSKFLRRTPAVGLALVFVMSLSFVSCDSSGEEGQEEEVLFRMTSDDDGSMFEIRPVASWHEPTEPPCQMQLYDIAGTNRYFQFATLNEPTCAGIFEATIEHNGVEYFLSGTVLRVFGVGSGPFATGTWSELNGTRSGTFQFYEGGFMN